MKKIESVANISFDAKLNAFPYQFQAYNTIKDMEYSAIFHEQGLGKTKIAVDLILYWLENKNIDTVLVVTKKQLVKNWEEEISEHSYLKPMVLSNNKSNNFYVFNSPCPLVIANFETISTEKYRMELFLKSRNVAIIIDESTKIKNPNSQITQNFFELADYFKIRTIMSGTPVANRPYDIWSQIYFLDKGKSLGGDFIEFKNSTDLKNNFSKNDDKRIEFEESIKSIYAKISSFSVRETKKSCGIELPTKEYITIYSDFETVQKNMYFGVVEDMILEIKKDGSTIIDDSSEALKRLLRLLQITSNPKLIDENYDSNSSKENKLFELVDKIIEKNEKVIIWTNFIKNVDYFTEKFSVYGAKKIHGALSIEERNDSVEAFKKDHDTKILIATPQAAKEGLTLTVANNVIFYDRGFNLDDYLQAQDRIHRISQTKKCYIYNLIVNDSIDEWIEKLIEAKYYAAMLTQGDILMSEFQSKMNYSYGDIIRNIIKF